MKTEELKTVKDLKQKEDTIRDRTYNYALDDAKAEAVKWFQKKLDGGDDCCCTCEEVWREFFNLTEEDLK